MFGGFPWHFRKHQRKEGQGCPRCQIANNVGRAMRTTKVAPSQRHVEIVSKTWAYLSGKQRPKPRWLQVAWPRISTKYRKKIHPPPGRNSGTQRKYSKNTAKYPKTVTFGGILAGAFFRYFRGILGVNSGSPEFRGGGGIFQAFLVETPGRAILGLGLRSGCSQPQPTLRTV